MNLHTIFTLEQLYRLLGTFLNISTFEDLHREILINHLADYLTNYIRNRNINALSDLTWPRLIDLNCSNINYKS